MQGSPILARDDCSHSIPTAEGVESSLASRTAQHFQSPEFSERRFRCKRVQIDRRQGGYDRMRGFTEQ